MQRNTITELGKLHDGDRFCYLKRADPWQVIDTKGTKVAVNQIDANGERIYKYDDFKSPNIQVRFLRHTKPLPQEECLINDLQPGDVFFLDSNVVLEYVVTEKAYPVVTAESVFDRSIPVVAKVEWMTWVTFVRNSKS